MLQEEGKNPRIVSQALIFNHIPHFLLEIYPLYLQVNAAKMTP